MTRSKTEKKYHLVGLGGTFDHFHQGHAWFLQQAAALSENLIVGVSTPSLHSQKTFAESIESYEDRVASVKRFLTSLNADFSIVPLETIEGPTVSGSTIEAVIVTDDTKRGGEYINQLRLAADLPALPIEVVALKQGSSSVLISSQNIRAGTHNRLGIAYDNIFAKTLVLTDEQRQAMRIVQGELVETPDSSDNRRYLVGDSTLRRFLHEHQSYEMAIIDGKEQRETYYPLVIDRSAIELVVVNPAGAITTMLTQGLKLALRQQLTYIFVDGEEDLAAVVLQLLLPLGSTIYYGQPDAGLVRWQVTEAAKEKTALLLNPRFQTNPKLVE